MSRKVLIVGGVAGGASAAARLRRLDESLEIILLERGEYISFANCGLPYYIGDTIKERSALLVQTPLAMRERFNIDVRIQNEVLSIQKENKTVTVKDIASGHTYVESYDTLVLSPGSSPIKPNIAGINSPNIFTLWTLPDTDAIKQHVSSGKVKRAVVIGGGFIGIEMVENLHALGLEVTLVEMANQVMMPVDFELAQLIHNHISAQGVQMHLGNGVKSFHDEQGKTIVELQDGTQVMADVVILAIGVVPNGKLAKEVGLEVNARGGIIVNDQLQTSDSSIYAIGDVIEVKDYVSGQPTMIPLAGPANKQGRIVADVICGRESRYEGTQGTSVAKIFDLTVSTTGMNEKTLNRQDKVYGKDYLLTLIQPNSHAGYYPGAMPITLKVIFDMAGKVLGAQGVGYEGVEKRIDVIATSMRFNATVRDLERLELAYAPPYSSAKDPVNMAGYSAMNILSADQSPILWREIANLDLTKTVILDVRDEIECSLGGIANAINIPLNQLRDRINELPKEKEIVVYCAVGLRGYVAARQLSQYGYQVKNLIGGYNIYKFFFQDFTLPSCMIETPQQYLGDDGAAPESLRKQPVNIDTTKVIKINACGLQCPGPILQVHSKMAELVEGDVLEVTATDPGFVVDAQAWCKKTGNTFISSEKKAKEFVLLLQKGSSNAKNPELVSPKDGSTMVVFSGDLDKALAAMIIANGAAAMGKNVTMFFTFWGLNILRKHEKVAVKKSLIESMFGMMMPQGTQKLTISKMNMGGMGSIMIRKVMKDKNVNTLDELIASALKNGVKFVACTMSMDIMGIKEQELIDGVDFGGVASYLGAAEDANHNLFI